MNDQAQNPNINSAPPVPSTPPVQVAQQLPMDWKPMLAKVKPYLMAFLNKIYSNKKIFWPVSIALGLIFLVIILGLLFGRRGTVQNQSKIPTPTPFVQNTPQASASGNILIDSENKLNDLKNQINSLDVNESQLQPPTLDYGIKF